MKTRTYRFRVQSRACDLFGAVDYTTTETITETPDGLLVEMRSLGVCEGERVDQRSSKLWPGGSLESAHEYRVTHGYEVVS